VNSAPDLRSLFEWARSLPELYECRNCHEPVEISTEHYLRWYPYWSCFTRTQHTTYAEHLRVQREARQERAKRVAILLACCLGTAYLLVGIFLGGPL
jgi:hypothetical protein